MAENKQTKEDALNTVRPLIQSFLERTTAEQWKSFTLGSPDDSTKILVAEMILELISTLSKSMFMAVMSTDAPESEEDVLSCLDESLPQSFSEAFGIPEHTDNGRLKSLTKIIKEEVRENVDSALSNTSQPGVNQHITAPTRLNTMVAHIIEFFKKVDKMISFAHRPRKSRLEDVRSTEEISSVDSINSQTAALIRDEITNELSDVISPLLDDVPETECKNLQAEISLEIQNVANNVTTLLCEEKKTSQPLKTVRNKIKAFFAKCFAKVCLTRIFTKLNKNHPRCTKAESPESVEPIIDGLVSQLPDNESQQAENENSMIVMFRNMAGDKVSVFTEELSNLLYCHSLPEPFQIAILKNLRGRNPNVPRLHTEMYSDIRSNAWIFVVMMNWFLKTRVRRHSEKVKLPIMEGVCDSGIDELTKAVESAHDAELCAQRNKTYIKLFIEKLFFKVCRDSKMLPKNRYSAIDRLCETVWDKLQGEELHINPENFKHPDEIIYKNLFKSVGPPEMVLFLMSCEDPVIVETIISIINKDLTKPPKEANTICSFFRSLGKVLCRPFKRRIYFVS